MEKKFELQLDDISSKFSSFYTILERLPEFSSFKRDIRINNILDSSKRTQFDILEIKGNPLYGTTGQPNHILGLSTVSFKVKSMTFIIKNEIVEGLSITIETMETKNGEIIEGILNNDIDVQLKIAYINGMISPYGGFYLE